MTFPSTQDRYQGALLGLATGDAVGTTVEFQRPGSFEPVTDMTGGGQFELEPGQWTDDTSTALCLAESLIERQGFDPVDQMARYVRWWREGHLSSNGTCFDIGNTVRGALQRFEASGEPFSGSTDPNAAGNGSIMRLAPVPLFFANAPVEAIRQCGESSCTTHGARTAVDACRYLGALIIGALQGVAKAALLEPRFTPVAGFWEANPLCPEIDAIARGSFREKDPTRIRGTGYVVDSLEAALWAFDRGRDFREGCLLAVNLGHDADTTAAVYGQLAGACYGVGGIPVHWLEKLAGREQLTGFADRLYALSR